MSCAVIYDGFAPYQLGVLQFRIDIDLCLSEGEHGHGVDIVFLVGTMIGRENVVLKECLVIDVGSQIVECRRHDVATAWHGAQGEQTVCSVFVLFVLIELGVIFTHVLPSSTMGDGVHRRYQGEGEVTMIGAHHKLGVGIGCLVGGKSISPMYRCVREYVVDHRVTKCVLRCQLPCSRRLWHQHEDSDDKI